MRAPLRMKGLNRWRSYPSPRTSSTSSRATANLCSSTIAPASWWRGCVSAESAGTSPCRCAPTSPQCAQRPVLRAAAPPHDAPRLPPRHPPHQDVPHITKAYQRRFRTEGSAYYETLQRIIDCNTKRIVSECQACLDRYEREGRPRFAVDIDRIVGLLEGEK